MVQPHSIQRTLFLVFFLLLLTDLFSNYSSRYSPSSPAPLQKEEEVIPERVYSSPKRQRVVSSGIQIKDNSND